MVQNPCMHPGYVAVYLTALALIAVLELVARAHLVGFDPVDPCRQDLFVNLKSSLLLHQHYPRVGSNRVEARRRTSADAPLDRCSVTVPTRPAVGLCHPAPHRPREAASGARRRMAMGLRPVPPRSGGTSRATGRPP